MSSSNAKKIFDEFFQNLKEFGDKLSKEDVDVAVESLQIAFEDLKHMKREAVQKKKEAEKNYIREIKPSVGILHDSNPLFNQ